MVNILQILICYNGHLGGSSVILILGGRVNTQSDLDRVCLEAEGDGCDAGQDGVG